MLWATPDSLTLFLLYLPFGECYGSTCSPTTLLLYLLTSECCGPPRSLTTLLHYLPTNVMGHPTILPHFPRYLAAGEFYNYPIVLRHLLSLSENLVSATATLADLQHFPC